MNERTTDASKGFPTIPTDGTSLKRDSTSKRGWDENRTMEAPG